MKTGERKTRDVRRSLRLLGLIALWLSGCGGGSSDDFGPTRKIGPPSGKGDSGAVASPVKPDASAKSVSREVGAGASAPEATAAKDAPTATPASASSEGADTKAERSDQTDAKNAVAAAVKEKIAPKSSREDDEPPAQVAKTATTPADPGKTEPAGKSDSEGGKPAKPDDSATETTPELTRQPMLLEVREWLLAKRRQASALDGLSVLTAADLNKVSWHDLRNGQLSREFFGRSGTTTGLGIGPKRNWLIGATEAGWVRLWTIDSQAGWDRFAREAQREAQAAIGGVDTQQSGVWALAVSPKGEWFVTGGEDGSLRKCSVETVRPMSVDDTPASSEAPQRTVKLEDKIEAHVGAVTALKLSADGAWLVSGGTDQRVRLWETKTWAVVRTWTDMPTQIVDVSVSPDGRIVAASGLDKFVRWWSMETPETPLETPKKETKSASQPANANKSPAKEAKPKNGLEHPDFVLAVAVSSDGNYVATACKDRMVRVWDLATGQAVEKHDGSKDAVVEVRLLDHDERLFFSDRAGIVRSKPRVRRSNNDDDVPPPTERTYSFTTPASALNPSGLVISGATDAMESSEIAALQTKFRNASSRNARMAVRGEFLKLLNSGADDGQAERAALEKQFASATNDAVKADLKRQLSRLKSVAVSQEKTEKPRLIGTLTDVFPNDVLTAQPERLLTAGAGVQLAFPADGELLTAYSTAVAGYRGDEGQARTQNQPVQLWTWDVATQTLLRHWDDVSGSIGSVAWLDSTNQLVSLGGHAFSLPNGQSRSFGHAAFDPIGTFAIAPDGKRLAVGFIGAAKTTSKVLRLLDADSLQESKTHEAFESLVTAIAFAPDGASLAVAIRERQVHRLLVLDAATLGVLATVEEAPHASPWLQASGENRDRGLTTLLFSADGRVLLTHGSYSPNDYRLTLWQKKGSKWSKESGVNSKASQPIIDDSRSPIPVWFVGGKGGQLAAITAKGLGIVETTNGKLLRSVELPEMSRDRKPPLAWSVDGTWLAQGDDVGNVTLWNLRVEKEAAIFPAQLGPVKALALSQDGRLLATLGEENKLHLWNLEGWQPKNRVAAKPKATKPAPASSD